VEIQNLRLIDGILSWVGLSYYYQFYYT